MKNIKEMEIIRSYTTIEQSRKLAEILPIESADMGWYYSRNPQAARNQMWAGTKAENADILAWSLAALLDVLDRGALFKTPEGWACQSYTEFEAITSDYYNNPIDAGIAIIEKFHEQKLL